MSRFNTLLQREWMQHHRGWLILLIAPPLLFLAMVPFATVHLDAGDLSHFMPAELMLMAMFASTALVVFIAAVAITFQSPGLARRDRQDRSIEFWLSLPTSHTASVGATVLAHLVLLPLLALLVGTLLSPLIGLAVVIKLFGPAPVSELPWGQLIEVGALGLLRNAFGVVLACLWLGPLLLAAMAASAWLKRWGVPVLGLGLLIAHGVLATLYDTPVVGQTVRALTLNAGHAIVHGEPPQIHRNASALAEFPAWYLSDAMASLNALGQPLFAFALVASAACFGLLVWRRSRSS
jgi:ABC-2 type transport system permease protein